MKKNRLHRHIVVQVVVALQEVFEQGLYADKVIERKFKENKKWGGRDRKFFAECLYDVVRWWRKYLKGLGIIWRDPSGPDRVSEKVLFHLVAAWAQDQGYEISHIAELSDFDSLKYKKNLQTLSPAEANSIPNWLEDLGMESLHRQKSQSPLANEVSHGVPWHEIIEAMNQVALVFLRVNTLKVTRKDLLSILADQGFLVEPDALVESAIRLKERANVFTSSSFKQGFFEVQDGGSQLIAPFLQVEPGHRVWDACAGAGGKSLHLAALMKNKGKIIASDIHDWKLNELKKRAKRDGVDVIETKTIDSKWIKRQQAKFDRVLLDVPCSGLGVLKRNPDSKWKLSLQRIQELQQIQQQILQEYQKTVKPGGKMVYATCSILPQENHLQIENFIRQNPQWTLEDSHQIWPQKNGFDGFYMARMINAGS